MENFRYPTYVYNDLYAFKIIFDTVVSYNIKLYQIIFLSAYAICRSKKYGK